MSLKWTYNCNTTDSNDICMHSDLCELSFKYCPTGLFVYLVPLQANSNLSPQKVTDLIISL